MTLGRWPRRLLIAGSSMFALGLLGWGALFIPGVYFRVAFLLVQRTSVMRDRVDWPALRAEADQLRRGARTTADTYPALRLVLQRLGTTIVTWRLPRP